METGRAAKWMGIALAGLLIGLASVQPALSQASDRDLKKLDRRAEKELEAGRTDAALALYRELLGSSSPGHGQRAEALWRVGVSEFDSDPATARTLLGELIDRRPVHPQSAAAQLLLGLSDSLAKTEGELGELRQQLAAQEEAAHATAEELEGAGEANTSLEEEIAKLRRQLQNARREIDAKDEELAKKDEDLQKLKQALVGGS